MGFSARKAFVIRESSFGACGEKANSSNKLTWCEVINLAKSNIYFALELSNRHEALGFLEICKEFIKTCRFND